MRPVHGYLKIEALCYPSAKGRNPYSGKGLCKHHSCDMNQKNMEEYCRHERHDPNIGPIVHQQHVEEETWQTERNRNLIIRRQILSPFKRNVFTGNDAEEQHRA
eukprot:TRINITY_DN4776_c0_g1_i1.p2 TRINITY_DN4776_c0_g1~~TRINITY_DN4776_c0_g1_i1.p2  ORF type:complete len:104 (-),score=1.86 TRINITY_DN4776_c0_g1_i1:251-562(-)